MKRVSLILVVVSHFSAGCNKLLTEGWGIFKVTSKEMGMIFCSEGKAGLKNISP